jgi:hypothetical protein
VRIRVIHFRAVQQIFNHLSPLLSSGQSSSADPEVPSSIPGATRFSEE